MKIVSSKQMAEIEAMAYRKGASESEFMEEAGSGVALTVQDFIERAQCPRQVILLCGKGNNSGDAYVAGIDLLQFDYEVTAYQTVPIEACSSLCRHNFARFVQQGGKAYTIESAEEFQLPQEGTIIDGLFGTGFRGTVEEPFASIIQKVNESQLPVISIDIPSGLDGDSGIIGGIAVKAEETAFLGLPKMGFFLNNGWDYVGRLRYVNFGLGEEYIDSIPPSMQMLENDELRPWMPEIQRSRHKYEAGYVIGVAGSPGMSGAAALSGWSALTAGAGIVRLFHPEGMEAELSGSAAELIKSPYDKKDLSPILKELERANALYLGPGLGRDEETGIFLKNLLPRITVPCVIDADALNLIAKQQLPIPEGAILTPHHGEMGRLLTKKLPDQTCQEMLEECQNFCEEQCVTIVLKGAPTFILHPEYPISVNPTGDPGMATAGSGDVLTGLIAANLAQGLEPYQAAALGVFLHGLAGEFAATILTSYSVTASDIIDHFPDAFSQL